MSKVWLITGSGNGLGRDIAEAALAADDRVVAGARRTEELAPLVAQYGERVKPVKLEVRDEAAAKAAVHLAVEKFGRLDVLVNNAGYGQIAPFEEANEVRWISQAVVDTCFTYGVGVHHARRRAGERAQAEERSHLSGVFPVGGRIAVPGNTPYHAAKDGLSAVSATLWRWKSRRSEIKDLHARAGRAFGPTGHGARVRIYAGPAAGVRGLGRCNAQDFARTRRTCGRRSAKDRGRNSATGEQRRGAGAADPRCRCGKAGAASRSCARNGS